MAFSNTIKRSFTRDLQNKTGEKVDSNDVLHQRSVSVAPGATNHVITWNVNGDDCSSICIYADKEVTVKPNNANPFTVGPDAPYVWTNDVPLANRFAGSMATINVANAGASAALVEVQALAQSEPTPNSYLWKHWTTDATARRFGVIEAYVQDGPPINGTSYYGVHEFKPSHIGILNYTAQRLGAPCQNIHHAAMTKTGNWTTTASNESLGGSYSYAYQGTDSIQGTVNGHAIVLRQAMLTFGGFAFVTIDGVSSLANRCREVTSADYKAISNVANNGSGLFRVTCQAHGFSSDAIIRLEGVNGAPNANGLWRITKINDDVFDLFGSTFAGAYTTGGSAGFFALADMGKRYINFFSSSSIYGDIHTPLADGLISGSHTVVITRVGTALGSFGIVNPARILVAGLSVVRAGLDPTATDNGFAYLRDVNDWKQKPSAGVPGFSAIDLAIEYTPTGASAMQFALASHDNEAAVSATWSVDGATVTPASGAYNVGKTIKLVRATTARHGQTSTTNHANYTATYTVGYVAGSRFAQVIVEGTLAWLSNASVGASYPGGMLPCGPVDLGVGLTRNYDFDIARAAGNEITNIADNNNSFKGAGISGSIYFRASTHDVLAEVIAPDIYLNYAGYANTGAQAVVQDRSDGVDKGYLSRSATTAPISVTAGDVWSWRSGWSVRKVRA